MIPVFFAVVALAAVGARLGGAVPLFREATAASGCRVDAQWYGSLSSPGGPNLTVAIKTSFGPPAVVGIGVNFDKVDLARLSTEVPGFYEVAHSAVGCSAQGCLYAPGHGCSAVTSGNRQQCVWWDGPGQAAAACEAWADCQSFWCGKAPDVVNSTNATCWARGTAAVDRDIAFHNATSYVRASNPNKLEAVCSSVNCAWVYGGGVVQGSAVNLSTNTGETYTGTLADDCSAIHWTTGGSWTNVNQQVKRVHVVFMAHFDVGYTVPSVQELLNQYITQWFPMALNTSRALRERGGREQFAWTSHPWLLLALLRNDSGTVPPEFLNELEQGIARGDILWHANPMNMQSESGERLNAEYGLTLSKELNELFGKNFSLAASQKDCPGATLGMIKMLSDAGVKMLHMGVNDFSTVPALPVNSAGYHGYCNPFMWTDTETPVSAGEASPELAVLYCSGYSGPYEFNVETPNMAAVIPGMDDALAFLMHVDNRGPQTAQQVIEGYAAVHRAFPNAQVKLSTLDAWTQVFTDQRKKLPKDVLPTIANKEPGDTWIYGMASQPTKMRIYRAAARVAAAEVTAGRVQTSDPRFREFNRFMIKIPEHTWGDGGACEGNFTNAQFHDPKYDCRVGGPAYNTAAGSWLDQQNFVPRAIEALQDLQPLRSECEAAIADSAPSLVANLAGVHTPFDWQQPVSVAGGAATVRFNGSAAVVAMTTTKDGRVWATADQPLGLFRYATHSQQELDSFASNYTLRACSTACGNCGFSKCGLDKAGAESGHHCPQITAAQTNGTHFLFNLTFAAEPQLFSKYGAPAMATLMYSFSVSGESVDVAVDLQWFNKTGTRMAESLWMTFAPAGFDATGWQMDKLGRWVDPLSVVTNGSKTMHAIWSGIRHVAGPSQTPDLEIVTLDAPTVSPHSLTPTGVFGPNNDPRPQHGWHFNLFNNAWSTNFPFFTIVPDERFRWTLRLPTTTVQK